MDVENSTCTFQVQELLEFTVVKILLVSNMPILIILGDGCLIYTLGVNKLGVKGTFVSKISRCSKKKLSKV